MEAKTAREISEKAQITFVDCLTQIKSSAENGNTQTSFFNAKPTAIIELMKSGYNITIHKDAYNGTESHLCSW